MTPKSNLPMRILDFLCEYHADRSYMPSIREIQAGCGISSTSVVDYNLRLLERDGHIRRSPDISRAIEIVSDICPQSTGVVSTPQPIELTSVPILGAIAAGEPFHSFEAGDYHDADRETIALPSELTPRNTDGLYALRVKGYSMIDAFITDGDIVVLGPASDVRNGDMVAASRDGEATLKHFHLEGDHVRLMPANTTMEPIIVPADQVQVHGRVVAVMRRVAA